MGMERKGNQRSDARFSVVIVDDHPMVRDGLAVMLEARRLARVIAKTSGVDETVRAVHKLGMPDIVLSDIRMPNGDGFELLKKLRAFWPGIRVLLLAGMPLKEEEARAREGGAAGYLPKSCDIDILADAIKSAVADAKTFICESFNPPGMRTAAIGAAIFLALLTGRDAARTAPPFARPARQPPAASRRYHVPA